MSFSIRAPASSANLGPGFDALAIGINLWMRVDVWPQDGTEIVDGGSPDLYGGENLVLTTARDIATARGWSMRGARVSVASDIPVARGLGSSAAAIVCGIQLAAQLAGQSISTAELITIGGDIEGHADNVAAAVLGGVTVSVRGDEGYLARRLTTPMPWSVVLFIPSALGLTVEARSVLPSEISIEDAVYNIGRSALLVQAVMTGDPEALRLAMHDRIHQPHRASLFPHLGVLASAAVQAGAAGACLSGAGPAILALTDGGSTSAVAEAMREAAGKLGVEGEVVEPGMAKRGCYIVPI